MKPVLSVLSFLLVGLGVAGVGVWIWSLADEEIYQEQQQRTLEEQRRARQAAPPRPGSAARSRPRTETARIEIPRVGVSAMIAPGLDKKTLRRAVGHIPGTAWFGQPGNVGLAGHRDRLFRGLKDVRKGDIIVVEAPEGTFRYAVESLRVVAPDDVGVLAATGTPNLTLVTCYPFYYTGPSPRRFIVHARQVSSWPQAPKGS